MARQLRWRTHFKSLNNRDCWIYIYAEGWTGGVTDLIAAANPFVFDEDDTDNLLEVIRVKTGFLRIIEEKYGDLTDMYPLTNTQHFVSVTYNNTPVFTGFMQAQSFETKLQPGPRVLEFPVVSPLGTLGGRNMPVPSSPSYITLATALKRVAEAMDSEITNIVFPDYLFNSTIRTLSYRINTLSYCPYNKEFSQVPTDTEPVYKPIKVSEFLEYICNCFALIVHDMPGLLVFSRYDYLGTYNQYSVNTLDSDNPSYTAITNGGTERDLKSFQPMSDDNTESTVLPVSSLTINYDDEFFPDYEIPFNRCKARYSQIGSVIMQPQTDEITSNYLLTNSMPTPGVAGVTVGAYGRLDPFANLDEMVLFSFPSTASRSTQIFSWKLYSVPKYFGYGCVLSFTVMVISKTDHEANNAHKGMKVGIIMKNGNYYRQADGTWKITSGQYIDEQTTDDNGEIRIEYHQAMPDIGTPLEVIICAGDFRGTAIGAIKDMKFSRTDISFFQYAGHIKNSYNINEQNGSPSIADIAQTITTARPSEDMVITPTQGTSVGSATIMCNYDYMMQIQHRIVLDTYIMPHTLLYLQKILIGNSIKKRIVGFGFDLWNDIVTITAQGGSTL